MDFLERLLAAVQQSCQVVTGLFVRLLPSNFKREQENALTALEKALELPHRNFVPGPGWKKIWRSTGSRSGQAGERWLNSENFCRRAARAESLTYPKAELQLTVAFSGSKPTAWPESEARLTFRPCAGRWHPAISRAHLAMITVLTVRFRGDRDENPCLGLQTSQTDCAGHVRRACLWRRNCWAMALHLGRQGALP